MNLEDKVIGFIGGGNMATAIIIGAVKQGVINNRNVIVSSPSQSTLEKWKKRNIKTVADNLELIKKSDIIFLAFKPYHLTTALRSFDEKLVSSKLFVSILAGVSSQTIYNKIKTFHDNPRVIRVMPNTPALVNEGCTAISAHTSATEDDIKMVNTIFSAVGRSEIVPENLILPITGVAGSCPAFIYLIIEALSDGAVKQGLPRALATTFAAQTVLGSAKMVLQSGKHPGELKDDVCTPGGTTISGIHALEKGGLRAALIDAIEATVQRAKEIERSS
ncbi:hypothetical protein RUM44_009035 [Polyplax serrata]|uniref:Pyrroline-5-carboxylate reductase n=1 Tax=Polyplax serrata TaxID=468196 RepID=A0ABR1ARK9_POLSC